LDERVKFELGDSILGGWLLALVSLGSKRIITRKKNESQFYYYFFISLVN